MEWEEEISIYKASVGYGGVKRISRIYLSLHKHDAEAPTSAAL